uniref:NADH dehydrogenase subunit 4L n=1 Tax=Arcuatula senhousia TaxID=1954227 RepID=E2DHX2_ARCSE|nr:NADH dehydrogenase subunit 4L [Arcuatula senhousia]ACY00233.1 NADH dehydrogenase subunit 4L [Arcuatula senhousia]
MNKYCLLSLFISMEVVVFGLVILCVSVSFFYVASLKLVLCMAVCDAGVFLALIVLLVRRVGSDNVKSMSTF